MNETTARPLHAGQDYDPGYDVPDLRIGQQISGRTVIAAIREHDCAGLLPGLHIVTAYDPDPNQGQPYVTWEVAWQPYSEAELARMAFRPGMRVAVTGRWVATAGHYTTSRGDALTDMAIRAGVLADRRARISGRVLTGSL